MVLPKSGCRILQPDLGKIRLVTGELGKKIFFLPISGCRILQPDLGKKPIFPHLFATNHGVVKLKLGNRNIFVWRSFGVGIPIIHRKHFLVVPPHSNLQLPVTTRPWVYQQWPGSWPWEPIMMRRCVGLDYCIFSLSFQGGFSKPSWGLESGVILLFYDYYAYHDLQP